MDDAPNIDLSGEGRLVYDKTRRTIVRVPVSDVNCIPDADLLSRAVRECRHGVGRGKLPLWSVVARRFALGSTFASQLCRRFGCDPEEMVRVPSAHSK